MIEEELKPCPLCGDSPHVWAEAQGYGPRVSCQNHKCSMDGSYSVDDWNRRAPVTLDQAKEVLAEAGMAAVPVEPTEVMLLAAKKADCDHSDNEDWLFEENEYKDKTKLYKAMIKAAQENPDA